MSWFKFILVFLFLGAGILKAEEEPLVVADKRKIIVPEDELGYQRSALFRYGALAAVGYTHTAFSSNGAGYGGYSLGGSFFVDLFIFRSVYFDFEFGFHQQQASVQTATRDLLGGLLDFTVGVEWEFLPKTVGVFLGGGYSVGTTLTDIPPQMGVSEASDLSSGFGVVGLHYHFPRSGYVGGYVGLRGVLSFESVPVQWKQGLFVIALDIEG